MSCPACGRPVALARPSCLYCGAPLPAGGVPARETGTANAPAGAAPTAPPGAERSLLLLDAESADAAALQGALGLSGYEAVQLRRRGGWQLLRVAERAEAAREAARLGAGLRALAVPEAEARVALDPLRVSGGARRGPGLELRTSGGPVSLAARDLLLIVRGPIARERQADLDGKRGGSAAPAEGLRIHLHRLVEPRPLELDPAEFDFGRERPESGSALLELAAWVEALSEQVALDDGFRRLPPALAPSTQGHGLPGLARPPQPGAPARLGPGRPQGPVLLDNLAQFRFYSGWRAAVERRLRLGPDRQGPRSEPGR